MAYSIFEETMADMAWTDIEKMEKKNVIVLFPMGVIEEHGPHLCLGTDIYISYNGCKQIKKRLEDIGQKVLIVPPYYWGINNVTGAFPGSFTVRKETLKNMIYDILACLSRWGFENVFCFYGHGDIDHISAISDAIIAVRKDMSLNVRMVTEGFNIERFNLIGNEDYILPVNPPLQNESTQFFNMDTDTPELLDIHAGAIETSCMNYYYPECVNVDIAKSLKPTDLTYQELEVWSKGWDETRKLVPLGYAGSPANFENIFKSIEDLKSFDDYICNLTAQCILECIQ